MANDATSVICPECGMKGRKVKPVTPQSLLSEDARGRLDHAHGLRFCKNETCGVVYFGEQSNDRFATSDVSVPVFQKSTDPSRLVCYCFEYSVQSITDEVARTGNSATSDRIIQKCKEGLDRCEEMNPQGSCCLGNVRQVVKAAVDARTSQNNVVVGEEAQPDCCTVQKESHMPMPSLKEAGTGKGVQNFGLWSAGGALFAAALSSACCWLPLALIGFGMSAAGVSGFFEEYRLLFLGITAVLLGAGFYYVYFRKPVCAPGDACATPNPKLQRLNKMMLWIATVLVVLFAAFPNYIGALVGGDDEPPPIVLENSNNTQTE